MTYLSEFLTYNLNIIFLYSLSVLAVTFAISVIIVKNPVHAVLYLIGLFIIISLYLFGISLTFIALSYILVYVGAISILFIFILMLINIRISELSSESKNSIPLVIVVSLSLSVVLGNILNFYSLEGLDMKAISISWWDNTISAFNHITSIGNVMYINYFMWLMETSIILLLAMVGAIVITIKPLNSENISESSVFKTIYVLFSTWLNIMKTKCTHKNVFITLLSFIISATLCWLLRNEIKQILDLTTTNWLDILITTSFTGITMAPIKALIDAIKIQFADAKAPMGPVTMDSRGGVGGSKRPMGPKVGRHFLETIEKNAEKTAFMQFNDLADVINKLNNNIPLTNLEKQRLDILTSTDSKMFWSEYHDKEYDPRSSDPYNNKWHELQAYKRGKLNNYHSMFNVPEDNKLIRDAFDLAKSHVDTAKEFQKDLDRAERG